MLRSDASLSSNRPLGDIRSNGDSVKVGDSSATGLVKPILVGVTLLGGDAADVLVCRGLGAALRWDLKTEV